MSYSQAKAFVLMFLCGYAFLGILAHATSRGEEDVYPIFSWFLFVNVPPHMQSGFDVNILSVSGKPVAQPNEILVRPEIFALNGLMTRDIISLKRDLARAVIEHRTGDIAILRARLESHFHSKTVYMLSETRYDALDYFLTKQVATSTPIVTFTTP